MANRDWDEGLNYDWLTWSDRTRDAYGEAFNVSDEILRDPFVLTAFEDAFFKKEEGAQEALIEYLREEYGYEWEDVWDWEAWREAYGEAA
jgi:hypothetical protein